MQTEIRILKGTAMTVVKYGFEALALRKVDEDLFDVFHGNFLRIILATRMTGHIFKQ